MKALVSSEKMARLFVPDGAEEGTLPFLGLSPVQIVEPGENLGHLPPKRVFISTESIERPVGQIGETQKALAGLPAHIGIGYYRI